MTAYVPLPPKKGVWNNNACVPRFWVNNNGINYGGIMGEVMALVDVDLMFHAQRG